MACDTVLSWVSQAEAATETAAVRTQCWEAAYHTSFCSAFKQPPSGLSSFQHLNLPPGRELSCSASPCLATCASRVQPAPMRWCLNRHPAKKKNITHKSEAQPHEVSVSLQSSWTMDWHQNVSFDPNCHRDYQGSCVANGSSLGLSQVNTASTRGTGSWGELLLKKLLELYVHSSSINCSNVLEGFNPEPGGTWPKAAGFSISSNWRE